jgi:P-type Cu+ transporter
MVKDPVCGMQVEEKTAAAQVEHKGTTYYFCSEGCEKRFHEDPDKFIARSGSDWARP